MPKLINKLTSPKVFGETAKLSTIINYFYTSLEEEL